MRSEAIHSDFTGILRGKCRFHAVGSADQIVQFVTDVDPKLAATALAMRGSRLMRTRHSARHTKIRRKKRLAAKGSACGWLQGRLAALSAGLRGFLNLSHKPRSKIRIAPAGIVTSRLAVSFHPLSRPKIPMAIKSSDKRNPCHASRRALGRRAPRIPVSRIPTRRQ